MWVGLGRHTVPVTSPTPGSPLGGTWILETGERSDGGGRSIGRPTRRCNLGNGQQGVKEEMPLR